MRDHTRPSYEGNNQQTILYKTVWLFRFKQHKKKLKDLNFGKTGHSSSSILHLKSKVCFNQKFSAIWTVSSRTIHSIFLPYSVEF